MVDGFGESAVSRDGETGDLAEGEGVRLAPSFGGIVAIKSERSRILPTTR